MKLRRGADQALRRIFLDLVEGKGIEVLGQTNRSFLTRRPIKQKAKIVMEVKNFLLENLVKMTGWKAAGILLVTGLGFGMWGCETVPKQMTSLRFDPPVEQPRDRSKVELRVSTSAQRLYVVEGERVLLATPVTVGRAGSPTPEGRFVVRDKVRHRRRVSEPGAGYPMPYWIEFYRPGYGLHWGFIKPQPSTMGCVRMPLKAAKKVFDLVQVGTPIYVAKTQPWDETVGRGLPVLDDSALPNPPMSYMLSRQVFEDMERGKLWEF